MKTGWTKVLVALGLALAVATVGYGCGKDRTEIAREQQTKDNIVNLEKEMKALETHQANLGKMIKDMQAQLAAMQTEIDSEAPRLDSANKSIAWMRQLNTQGFGPSPFSYIMTHPAWNVPLVLTFLVLLWIFYRLRHRQLNKTS
jgi:uncharacterized protein HemX